MIRYYLLRHPFGFIIQLWLITMAIGWLGTTVVQADLPAWFEFPTCCFLFGLWVMSVMRFGMQIDSSLERLSR